MPEIDRWALLALAQAPLATAVADGDSIVWSNRAFAELVKCSEDAATSLKLSQIFGDEERASLLAHFDRVHNNVPSPPPEARIRRRDGSRMWVRINTSAGPPAPNERTFLTLLQFTDIGRAKMVEGVSVDGEGLFELALSTAGHGVWYHDYRDGTVFVSSTWRTMRGLDLDEAPHGSLDKWLLRVHPDDRERLRQQVANIESGSQGDQAYEYREMHRDGRYIWILSRGRTVAKFPDGRPAQIVGTDTDITALKTVEAALAEEKERLRITLNSIGEGVISTNAEGCVTLLNPVAERMIGWQSLEVVGRAIDEVFVTVDEPSGDLLPNPVREALLRKEICEQSDEAALLGRSGEWIAVRDTAAPVLASDGSIIGAVLVFKDVGESRALRKHLVHSASHDSLTGLPNRSAFENAVTEAADRSRNHSLQAAICFIDLDHFKPVNDTAGHRAGDALLREIAATIRRCCRSHDFPARIGGDEFAVLLNDCPIELARLFAIQLVDAISATEFVWQNSAYHVGASIGVAALATDVASIDELISRADAACYVAKARGRNRVAVHETEDLSRGVAS